MHASRLSCSICCCALLALLCLGCGASSAAGPLALAYSTPAAALTAVDWANFTYFSSCYGNARPFKARNGRARNGDIRFEVFAPVFGDLTWDGQVEAALPYECFAADSGGVNVFVYSGTAAHPRLLGQLPLPGQAGGAVVFNSLVVGISNEQIQLTGASYTPGTPRCCPDILLSEWYRWLGSRFVLLRSFTQPL